MVQRKKFNYVEAAFGSGRTGGLIYGDQVSKHEIWVVVFFFLHFNLDLWDEGSAPPRGTQLSLGCELTRSDPPPQC